MLHVGLLILKILGILLLSILGLVLLLLCIVLFVPVGYRLDMEKRERFQLKGRVSWLCRVLTAIFFVRWENSEDGKEDLHFRNFTESDTGMEKEALPEKEQAGRKADAKNREIGRGKST